MMKIKKQIPHFIALSFFLFVIGIGSLVAQKVWTLEECILYAFENNIQIKQSRLATESAEINLLQSKLSFAPTANANASLGNSWGRNQSSSGLYLNETTLTNDFGLNGRVDLFNGLQKWNTLRKNELDYQASLYQSEEMENNIALMLTQAYLTILFNHEMQNVAEQQVDVTKKQISRTEKLVEAGTLPKGDLLELQAQGASEETNLIQAQNNLSLAYLDLKQILDLSAETDFDIDFPKIEVAAENNIIPSEQVYANAVDIMPEIRAGELNVQSAERSIQIAKGSLYPSLSLNGGIGTNYFNTARNFTTGEKISYLDQLDNNTREYVSLSLNIPIFNSYSSKSQVKRAQVQSINQNFELELRKNELRKNIEQKYYDALAAYKTYNASKFSVESLAEAFKYTEEKFNVGMVNSIDYSIAKMKLTQAESDLLRSKYDYIFKTKILDFYMGIPLSL